MIKRIKYFGNEKCLLSTNFPRFNLKSNSNVKKVIDFNDLRNCKYLFQTNNFLFVVNFYYFENF